jgi:uncharacterized protein
MPPTPNDRSESLSIPTATGAIAGLWLSPPDPTAMMVFGHGAGAGMRHGFMTDMANALATRAVATLRWEMPAMTSGRRVADHPRVVRPLARAACEFATTLAPDLPRYAGGKSMGGRMTSEAWAATPIEGLRGLVFLGFPLHPAGAPSVARAAHLDAIPLPMLFVTGQRDALATHSLLVDVVARLQPRAHLYIVPGADHGLAVGKRAAIDPIALAANEIARWIGEH